MDSQPETPTCLPLDLDQVRKLLPTLTSISTELDTILDRYCELDRLFRQHFLSLFEGHGSEVQVHERTWSSLNRLHDLTRNANLIEGPLHWLALNNDRAILACNMLTMLLDSPSEPGESDSREVH